MKTISTPFNGKNYWRNKGYDLLDGSTQTKRSIQVVKFTGGGGGGGSNGGGTQRSKRFWRIKKSLKLKNLKNVIFSPKKIWKKFKDGYVNMMLKMAGEVGKIDGGSEFERKRISQGRKIQRNYKNKEEFEARLVIEIYKALSTSKGLSEVA